MLPTICTEYKHIQYIVSATSQFFEHKYAYLCTYMDDPPSGSSLLFNQHRSIYWWRSLEINNLVRNAVKHSARSSATCYASHKSWYWVHFITNVLSSSFIYLAAFQHADLKPFWLTDEAKIYPKTVESFVKSCTNNTRYSNILEGKNWIKTWVFTRQPTGVLPRFFQSQFEA